MVGIYYICTGFYKVMFNNFIKSLELFSPSDKKVVILLTDADYCMYDMVQDNISVEQYHIDDYPWPIITLFKMKYIIDHRNDSFSHVFYFNANCVFNYDIDYKDYDIVVTRHIAWGGDNFKFLPLCDDNPKSMSYIGNNYYMYVHGGFFGGKSEYVYKLCSDISECVRKDLLNNIIPKWHDETYLNKWIYSHAKDYNIGYLNVFGKPDIKIPYNIFNLPYISLVYPSDFKRIH